MAETMRKAEAVGGGAKLPSVCLNRRHLDRSGKTRKGDMLKILQKERTMRNVTQYLWNLQAAVVTVLLVLAASGYPAEQTTSNGYADPALLVTTQQVAAHLQDSTWRLVDVRSSEHYAAGHIPGAVSLPVATITQSSNGTPGMLASIEVVRQALEERGISRESQIVIYDDFGGDRATRLFWVLDYLGHPRMSVLQGGVDVWRQETRPLSQVTPQLQPTTYEAVPDTTKLATLDWVASHLQNPEVLLLDARSPAEFSGQVPGREVQRPGRITGAVNVDWVNNLTTSPRLFKAGTDLSSLYRQAGVTPDKEIVVYCRTGMRASHDYFVLRLLGYPRVRLYDGSYVEWAANTTVPVAR
jgi:thiosulfate/3-mercaptopyruvate sulfurtransferase